MAQTFRRLIHPGDAPHLAIALKRYVSNIEQSYSTLDSPVFTGDPQAPTPPTPDNDTSIATTAFVKNQNYAPLASPVFTGDPKAPTPPTPDNDTSIATTAFVKAQGYLTGNQTITLSGDISGSGATAITATLPNVNANVGSFQGLTVNAKGLVTAAANQSYAPLASPAFTGNPTVNGAAFAAGHLPGTQTNDDAAVGQVGEFVMTLVPFSSRLTLVNVALTNLASVSLTAGDWDVQGHASIDDAGANTMTAVLAGFSSTSATLPDSSLFLRIGGGSVFGTVAAPPPQRRFSLAATTTVYLVVQVAFTGTAATACGFISARRAR